MEERFKTKILGNGQPSVAVVACLHGNEPVGEKVHRWLETQAHTFAGSVKLVFGNAKAFKKDKRFINKDLNRVFPGKEDGCYEEQRALKIMIDLENVDFVLDIHSRTPNTVEPFAIIPHEMKCERFVRASTMENVFVLPKKKKNQIYSGMAMIDTVKCPALAIESGQHKSFKTENVAIRIMQNILQAIGILPGIALLTRPRYFTGDKSLREIERNMIIDDNIREFKKIEKGQVIARGVNKTLIAERSFYPVAIDFTFASRENGSLMYVAREV